MSKKKFASQLLLKFSTRDLSTVHLARQLGGHVTEAGAMDWLQRSCLAVGQLRRSGLPTNTITGFEDTCDKVHAGLTLF